MQLGALFADAGHQLFLVGGSVRDAMLDRRVEDFDFATDAHPEEIASLLEGWATTVYRVGEAFGTIAAVRGQNTVEVTTFRSEIYREESRKPHVEFSDSLTDDLARRDFTVNAMALALPELALVDPHGGMSDLAAQVLRTPSGPQIAFSDDPLRMLRLFRFQATLGFLPDAETAAAATSMSDRLGIVSAERIRDELSRLMVATSPSVALLGIVESGLARHFLPELPELAMEQDPVHKHKNVLAHTLAVVDKTTPWLTLRLAALLHDVGKPTTRRFGPGGVSFHHHEVVGARIARERLRDLRYPKEVVEDVARLVFLHLRPHTLKLGWTDSAVRRYVRDAGDLLGPLNELVRCDVTTGNPRRAAAIAARIDELEKRIAELAAEEELSRIRPPLDGHQVMAYLGIGPGPVVGEALDMLLERRLDDGPFPPDEAYAVVRDWALSRGLDDPGDPQVEEEE